MMLEGSLVGGLLGSCGWADAGSRELGTQSCLLTSETTLAYSRGR